MTSWKPEFEVNGAWYDNAQRFATKEEAERSARRRFMVWTMPTAYRATESPDPVTYRNTEDGPDERMADGTIASGHGPVQRTED